MTGMRRDANVAMDTEIGVGQPEERDANCYQELEEAKTDFPLEPLEKAQP